MDASDEDKDQDELSSKTQRKREAAEARRLGQQLLDCSSKQLQQLPIQPALANAIAEYHRLPNSHGARKRQLQFIGKMVRSDDPERIRSALESTVQSTTQTDAKEICRALAERLLSGGDVEIENLLAKSSRLDRQRLRQSQRSYRQADVVTRDKISNKLVSYLMATLPNPGTGSGPETSGKE